MNVFELNNAIKTVKEKNLDPETLKDTLESLELPRNEKLDNVATWIEENSMAFDEYDDVIVRRLVDTIQVNGDDTITVFLKGGVQITEGIK